MKTSNLSDSALDWAVAKCEGIENSCGMWVQNYWVGIPFSSSWAHGGPIIEREMIELIPQTPALWDAMYRAQHVPIDGPTPLVAAMRCYVANKLGVEIELLKELTA